MKRRHFLSLASTVPLFALSGCGWFHNLSMRSQSPEDPKPQEPHTKLVGELVVPTGLQPIRVDAVGLVSGLHGTGSDPSPSPQRAELLEEMLTRGVPNPNKVLTSGNYSLVVLQGTLRPGIQKGDRFDLELRVPSQSETTSLRGGYLLETRLTETAIAQNQLHQGQLLKGNLLALAKGPLMVDPTADPKKDRIAMCRGRILGGGECLKSRSLGLVVVPEHKSVANSSRVANAVNRRFHTFQNGIQTGVATAKTDEYIELTVHPRYKDNIARYLQVVMAVPLAESKVSHTAGKDPASVRMRRIASLERELLDPETSAEAAIQLEAIGPEGVESLLKAIKSKDPEIRFYAGEALAYLDRREAAEPLGQIARDEPAFRVFALTALSVIQDHAAEEQLCSLLSLPSAETRYGAFRGLWTMNKKSPLVRGEVLGGQFMYHVLDVGGPPMIHVTRSKLAEMVIFGPDQRFLTPLALNAGNDILVNCPAGDEVSVSKYSVADGDQKRTVSTRIDDVLRAIVELGGTYPDVVQALQEAKNQGALPSRFEVDALPEAGRTYDRVAVDEPSDEPDNTKSKTPEKVAEKAKRPDHVTPASPAPDLFYKKGDKGSDSAADSADDKNGKKSKDDAAEEDPPKKKGFFAKLLGR